MGKAAQTVKNRGRTLKRSVFLNHHFGGFDNGRYGITLLELEFVSATSGDRTLNQIVADTDGDMGHDIAQLNFFDLPRSLFLAEIGISSL